MEMMSMKPVGYLCQNGVYVRVTQQLGHIRFIRATSCSGKEQRWGVGCFAYVLFCKRFPERWWHLRIPPDISHVRVYLRYYHDKKHLTFWESRSIEIDQGGLLD